MGGGNPNPPVEACFLVSTVQGLADAGVADASVGDGGDAGPTDAGTVGATVDAGPLDSLGCPTDATAAVAVFQSTGLPLGWEPYKVDLRAHQRGAPASAATWSTTSSAGPGAGRYLVDDRARVAGGCARPGDRGWAF